MSGHKCEYKRYKCGCSYESCTDGGGGMYVDHGRSSTNYCKSTDICELRGNMRKYYNIDCELFSEGTICPNNCAYCQKQYKIYHYKRKCILYEQMSAIESKIRGSCRFESFDGKSLICSFCHKLEKECNCVKYNSRSVFDMGQLSYEEIQSHVDNLKNFIKTHHKWHVTNNRSILCIFCNYSIDACKCLQ